MAASCCVAATSTRFVVASSSCRARKTRTLAMPHYSSSSTVSSSSSSSNRGTLSRAPPGWAVSLSSAHSSTRPSPVSLRRFSLDSSLRSQHRHSSRTLAPEAAAEQVFEKSSAPASGRLWLEHLRRHTSSLENAQAYQSSRRQLSAILAFALCFVASGSSATATTTTSNQEEHLESSSDPSPESEKLNNKNDASSASGKPGKTKPTFMFSKFQAEKDVQNLQADSSKNPYLVSTSNLIFVFG